MSIRNFRTALRRRDDGAVAVVVAIMSIVLFGMGAMAVDLGNAWSRKRMTQTDADLAALAGAAQLPAGDSTSQGKACALAYEFLAKPGNLPSSDDGAGIPLQTAYCSSPSNGDITFPDSTHIRVVSPARQVDFGLAGILGFKNTSVYSVAVATVTSPKGKMLPFVMAAGAAAAADFCVKANSSSKGCGPSDSGDFGYADFPRDDSYSSQSLQANIAVGLQDKVTPQLFQAACLYYFGNDPAVRTSDLCGATTTQTPNTTANLQCNDPQLLDTAPKKAVIVSNTGAATEPSNGKNLFPGETCVNTETGNMGNKLTQGLLTWQSCKGKLAVSTSSVNIEGCYLAPDKFSNYFPYVNNPNPTNGIIDPSIVNDPRFGIVPVISVPAGNGTSDYAILTFYGIYFKNFYDNNGNLICPAPISGTCSYNQDILAASAYVFPLYNLPKTVPGDGGPIYIGTGPVIPLLTKDN